MKKLWITFLTFCILALVQGSFGQTKPAIKTDVDNDSYFESAQVENNDKTGETQLIGKVSFISKNFGFKFLWAERVVYNKATKKMTVYGRPLYTFYGKTIKKVGKNPRLEYTLGDSIIFLTIPPVKMDLDDGSYFESEEIEHDAKTNTIQFYGNVSFKSRLFEFVRAYNVIFNETNKMMSVYGGQEFKIDGKIVKRDAKASLEYKIGEYTVYID